MNIRKSTMDDLDILLHLYENARTFMSSHGNPTQWGTTYPEKELIISDIESGHSYVCEDHAKIIATFFYHRADDPDYNEIYEGDWLNSMPYGVVHRITSDGTVHGTASFCLEWALKQCGNLKIDTHHDNSVMQHLLEKNGFSYCGLVHLQDGTERLAYQKVL